MSNGVIQAGSRKVQKKGNSLAITFPKNEIEEELELDPEEILGEYVSVQLDSDGTYTVELGPLETKRKAVRGSD